MLLEKQDFHRAIRSIIALATMENRYLNEKQPWKTIKDDIEGAATTLYSLRQLVKALGVLLEPFLPFTAEKIRDLLNLPGSVHEQKWSEVEKALTSGHIIKKPDPLFRKIESTS